MGMFIEDRIEEMLQYLQKEEEKCNIALKGSPEGTLIATKRGEKTTFFNAISTKEGYKRYGISKNKALIRELCQKKYFEERKYRIEKDKQLLLGIKPKLLGVSPDDVLEALPQAYQLADKSYFFAETSQEDWAAQPYRQSAYKPDKRRFTTSRLLKVRSKSELIIAEKLYEHNIPFRYEQVLPFENTEFAPDFTVRKFDGKIVYWEHCGMTSDPGYLRYNRWKLKQYERMGIVPWDNLIVTYDTEDGILNIPLIESEIINKLKR